jgi:hypothetical protein
MLHVAFAEYVGTVDVSNRTEVRVRHTQDVVPDKSFDVVDAPTARVELEDRVWSHTLGYTALAAAPDVQAGLSPQLIQSADLGTAWHDRRVRIGVAEYAMYGELNTGFLLGGPPTSAPTPAATPPPGPAAPPPAGPTTPTLAAPTTLRMGSSRTVLATALTLSRRWTATTAVEYVMAGGVDTASQANLPLLRGPRGEATATYAATRLDGLETRASVQRGTTTEGLCSPAIADVPVGATCAPVTDTGQITEAWQRRLTRDSQATLGAGAAWTAVRIRPEDRFVDRLFPVVRASFEHARVVQDIRTIVRLDALLAPTIDVRTGVLDQRAQGSVALTLPFHEVTLSGSFSAARSVSSPFVRPLTALTGVLETAYHFSRVSEIGGGVRYALLEQEGLPRIAGGAAFLQATFHAPRTRF